MACTLFPGFFGVLVQGLLFAVTLCVLVLKKWREGPDRTWRDFTLDSSKQFIGAGWIHVANIGCAMLLGSHAGGSDCEWYWLNIMVDTTLGVAVMYSLLRLLTAAAARLSGDGESFKTGEYRDEKGDFLVARYVKQLLVWLACVTGMKFVMVLLLLAFAPMWSHTAHFVLGGLDSNERLQLIIVMVITPCCMNALQFWVVDNFIKKSTSTRDEKIRLQPPP